MIFKLYKKNAFIRFNFKKFRDFIMFKYTLTMRKGRGYKKILEIKIEF